MCTYCVCMCERVICYTRAACGVFGYASMACRYILGTSMSAFLGLYTSYLYLQMYVHVHAHIHTYMYEHQCALPSFVVGWTSTRVCWLRIRQTGIRRIMVTEPRTLTGENLILINYTHELII